MSYEPTPRWLQRLGGLWIALLGGGFWAFGWYIALTEGNYYRRGTAIMSGFFILGCGMIAFPDYKAERVARGEDITGLSGYELITPRWWIIAIIAVALALSNFLTMTSMANRSS